MNYIALGDQSSYSAQETDIFISVSNINDGVSSHDRMKNTLMLICLLVLSEY